MAIMSHKLSSWTLGPAELSFCMLNNSLLSGVNDVVILSQKYLC